MQQLLVFAFQLSIIAWLRAMGVTHRRSSRVERWCTELGFGVLIALPLF